MTLNAVLFVAAAAYAAFVARNSFALDGERYFTLFDDAMISMRFAQNFAAGHGLIWNPGLQPVEGYTNFLWTLWMAVAHRLPIDPALTVAITGSLLLLLHVVVVHRLAIRLAPDQPWVAMLAAGVVAFRYPLVYWTLRGMEVGFLALLVTMAALLAVTYGDNRGTGTALALASVLAASILTRTDAVVPAVIVAVWVAALPARRGLATAVALLACIVAVTATHGMWRYAYYGDPLPNTYYLKVTGVSAAERLRRGVLALGAITAARYSLLLPLAGIAFVSARSRRAFALVPEVMLGGLVLGQAIYSVYVGGDAWEFFGFENRYLSIATGPLVVLASLGLGRFVRWAAASPERVRASVLGLALVIAASAVLQLGYRRAPRFEVKIGVFLCLAVAIVLPLWVGFCRSTHWTSMRWLPLLAAAAVVLDGVPWIAWARWGAEFSREDETTTRSGITVDRMTPPETTLGVAWAGALAYYGRRTSVDLLGKCDAVVARGVPSRSFAPGHNKWDLPYSLGRKAPDLVQNLWPGVERDIPAYGYVKLDNGWFLRSSHRLELDAVRELSRMPAVLWGDYGRPGLTTAM